jgi:hypothetical protein
LTFKDFISELMSTGWWGCSCAPCLKRGSRYIPGHSHRQVKVVADICWGSTIERCLKALKQFFAAYSDSYSWGERTCRSVNSSFYQVNERILIVCHLFDTWKCKNCTCQKRWVAVTVFSPSHLVFRRVCKTAASCLSVCPHGTTRLPLDEFSWNFIFEHFSKIFRQNSSVTHKWQD